MRSFWITILLIVCLLLGWFLLQSYTKANVKDLVSQLDTANEQVLDENWDEAYQLLSGSLNNWTQCNERIAFALDKSYIIEIEDSYSRSLKYILAKDSSNCAGEIRSLQILLQKLVQFQEPTFDNIF